jgi:hypothetical protein
MWDMSFKNFKAQPLIVKFEIRIVLKLEFQTSFRYSRITFQKNFELKIVSKSILVSCPNFFLMFWSSNQKLWTNFKEDVWKGQKKFPSTTPLKFVYNFLLEYQNMKRIFGHETWIDLPTFFSSKFVLKSYSTISKWSLKF